MSSASGNHKTKVSIYSLVCRMIQAQIGSEFSTKCHWKYVLQLHESEGRESYAFRVFIFIIIIINVSYRPENAPMHQQREYTSKSLTTKKKLTLTHQSKMTNLKICPTKNGVGQKKLNGRRYKQSTDMRRHGRARSLKKCEIYALFMYNLTNGLSEKKNGNEKR